MTALRLLRPRWVLESPLKPLQTPEAQASLAGIRSASGGETQASLVLQGPPVTQRGGSLRISDLLSGLAPRECGHWTCSTRVTRELVTNAEVRAPAQSCWLSLHFNKIPNEW